MKKVRPLRQALRSGGCISVSRILIVLYISQKRERVKLNVQHAIRQARRLNTSKETVVKSKMSTMNSF